jgi:DNA repair protein RadC
MMFDNLLNAFGPLDTFTDRKIRQLDELMEQDGIGPERAKEPAKVLEFPQKVKRAFEQVRQMSEEEIAERTKRDLANFDRDLIAAANNFVVE